MHSIVPKAAVVLVLSLLAQPLAGQRLQPRKKILASLTLANSYFMKKWPDVGKRIVTNRDRASNIWTRAVYYEGLMALYRLDPRPAYYDYAVRWGEFHHWDLRDGITYTRNADNQCAGQTYIELYLIDRKPERIQKIKASIDSMMRTDKIDDWTWVDAIQMSMPVFAKLGVVYKDDAYFERMYAMYMYSRDKAGENGLYNPQDHLWWRDKDFDPPYEEPDGKPCYWSRGNGWVFLALARVLEVLPENAPHRDQFVDDFKAMATALAKVQRPDGFWNASLHDPEHFGGRETSGTALFAYGMAFGVNHGYLPSEEFYPTIVKAWNGLTKYAVHKDGFLGYVQGTGKEPKDGQPVTADSMPDFEDYGLGCFLLAGGEVSRLRR
jgi:unsaturated rhamnogalacturonyl hydrolase